MSEQSVVLIPEQIDFIPTKENQERAVIHFRNIAPTADEIICNVNEHLVFEHCAPYFESVLCPACKKKIDIRYWGDWMDEDFDGRGFCLSERVLPCCGTRANLHSLEYDLPQGFARFRLEARNPDIGNLGDQQQRQFEEMLGCRLRVIYRRM